MNNPNNFYKQEAQRYKTEVSKLYKQLTALSTARILVFLATAIGAYFSYPNWQIMVAVIVFGGIGFVYLLSKYTDIKKKHIIHKALLHINTDEINIASGDFYNRAEGLEFQNPTHHYSLDIDLFGRGSFFQFINRTATIEGKSKFATLLLANSINNIPLKQDAIKELSAKPKWRQYYNAIASLIKVETPAKTITDWLRDYKSFMPKLIKWLPLVFSIATLVLFGLILFKIISPEILGYWLLLGLALTGKYLKKINSLAANTDKVKDTFKQYAQLLNEIESEKFTSKLLLEKQQLIKSEEKKASLIFTELSKAIDALDNRNNLISAIFGNGLFLTDIKNAYKIEQWILTYNTKVNDWFEVVSFFDAYNTLGNYTFNHPDFVFPDIVKDSSIIKAKQLGHPLLDKAKLVTSDVTINNEEFFIVTGANMAGKSTFLRTISLHIVMANIGLPVCATSSVYNPVKLITSMRTSDSLTDESSYFFSELTRLKCIVDAIQKEPYFIILDEILKGTNSTDKAIGSRKFVEKLVASDATGIIATHDLSLCEIEKELEEVKNYYFDAQIVDDELYFDYTFKKGICQNMNASFLLKKMEIV
ncbi:MutS-related protein [Lacinutrix salivirga]